MTSSRSFPRPSQARTGKSNCLSLSVSVPLASCNRSPFRASPSVDWQLAWEQQNYDRLFYLPAVPICWHFLPLVIGSSNTAATFCSSLAALSEFAPSSWSGCLFRERSSCREVARSSRGGRCCCCGCAQHESGQVAASCPKSHPFQQVHGCQPA